jgi:hypothetical protein
MKVIKQLVTLLLLHTALATNATTFTLIASGTWNNPAIWSPAGIPSSGDDVVFSDNGTPLSLTLIGDVTIRSLNYDGDYRRDTLKGAGTVQLLENSIWIGGWIAEQVVIVVPAGKTLGLNLDSDTSNRKCLADSVLIINNGTMIWQNLGIFYYGNALIHNLGTFIDNTGFNRLYRSEFDSSPNYLNLGFINDGTFISNSQELTIHVGFINNGTVNIQSGWAHGDIWLENNGTFNLNASGQQNHEFYNFRSKNGTLHFGVNTTFVVANTLLNGSSSIGTVSGNNGTLVFGYNGSQAVTAIHAQSAPGIALNFGSKGKIGLYTDLTVHHSGNFEKSAQGNGKLIVAPGVTLIWKEGFLSGNAQLEVSNGATLNIYFAPDKGLTDTASLINHGLINFQGGVIRMQSAQASIQNNGTFRLQDNSPIQSLAPSGTPVFYNNGLFEKTAGSGSSQIQAKCINGASGTLSASSGILEFFHPVSNQGRLMGNTTISLPFNQSTLGGTLAPGYPSGTLNIYGGFTFSGTVEIDANGNSVDRLEIGGQLVLSPGSKLKLLQGPNLLPPNASFTMVRANGNISGTFSAVEFPCSNYQLSYSAQQAMLQTGASGAVYSNNTWTGATGMGWTEAANWSSGLAPTLCHNVEIPANSSVLVQQGIAAIAHVLTVGPGSIMEVELGGELTVSGD